MIEELVEPTTGIDLDKVEPPTSKSPYSFTILQFSTTKLLLLIQVWRVAVNVWLFNKQSRAVDMGWAFGLNV